jgi:hypothetical protein
MEYTVTIPEWEASYLKSEKIRAKYWLWKDRDKLPKKYKTQLASVPLIRGAKAYCQSTDGERFVKNTKKVGTQNRWILNGQDLYNAALNWRLRKNIAKYYHEYFSDYIGEQLQPLELPDGYFFSISCDIYEIQRGNMPDVSNMWLLEKFFEDALQECGIIPDDNPDYVRESGRKRYHFVETAGERKLIFTIKLIKDE